MPITSDVDTFGWEHWGYLASAEYNPKGETNALGSHHTGPSAH